jgi:glucose 1-dehydrogenase
MPTDPVAGEAVVVLTPRRSRRQGLAAAEARGRAAQRRAGALEATRAAERSAAGGMDSVHRALSVAPDAPADDHRSRVRRADSARSANPELLGSEEAAFGGRRHARTWEERRMRIDLSGRRVLVTGGNSGLGAAMVRAFAAAGARVAVNYVVHPELADRLVDEVRRGGGEALAVAADVSEPGAVAEMFRRLDTAWGGLDVLVNNAGIDGPRAVGWEADVAAWRRVLEINLLGAFHCAREALKRMVPKRSGVILNTSSVHEVIAWTGYSAYAASKAGLSMLAKTLAQEAGPHGVRVLCLAPGAIQTPINAQVW